MKTFVNETLGEPWKDQLGEIEDFDFLLARRGDCGGHRGNRVKLPI
jgi:phage terminase large subunit GpA-like protein